MAESKSLWHREVLPTGWTDATRDLRTRRALDGFYLAGGTALALQRGHRLSVDLDLFSESDFASSIVRDRLRGLDGLRNLELAPGTLHLELRGVKVSFLHYPYPLLFPLVDFDGLAVADPRDIACMKLDALASRGTRRDFVDLHLLAEAYTLPQIVEWFATKYAAVSFNRTHLFKALTYFADAEQEPMPDMLLPLSWTTVRQVLSDSSPPLAASRLRAVSYSLVRIGNAAERKAGTRGCPCGYLEDPANVSAISAPDRRTARPPRPRHRPLPTERVTTTSPRRRFRYRTAGSHACGARKYVDNLAFFDDYIEERSDAPYSNYRCRTASG